MVAWNTVSEFSCTCSGPKYIDVYALISLLKFGMKYTKVRPFGHAVQASC